MNKFRKQFCITNSNGEFFAGFDTLEEAMEHAEELVHNNEAWANEGSDWILITEKWIALTENL